jgi:ATP-dependent Lon protease
LPKQLKATGLHEGEISVSEAAIRDIVRYYTREAGVRALERELSKICRKAVKQLLTEKQAGEGKPHRITVTPKNLDKYLGVRRYTFGMAEKQNQVGQVTGLAWTEVGGELLTIEAVTMNGKGKTITTGKLGDVMQESIQAALSVVRARSRRLGVKEDFYQKNDMHIHLPEGATPKDGPSAGIGIVTAMVSVLTGIPVRSDVAMTGEITLRGEVLQIGGLKEKLLAAHRGGIKTVLIPEENVKDRHPGQHQEQIGDLAGEVDRQGSRDRTRAPARPASGSRRVGPRAAEGRRPDDDQAPLTKPTSSSRSLRPRRSPSPPPSDPSMRSSTR